MTAGGLNTGGRRVLREARTAAAVVLALHSGGGRRLDAVPTDGKPPRVRGFSEWS